MNDTDRFDHLVDMLADGWIITRELTSSGRTEGWFAQDPDDVQHGPFPSPRDMVEQVVQDGLV